MRVGSGGERARMTYRAHRHPPAVLDGRRDGRRAMEQLTHLDRPPALPDRLELGAEAIDVGHRGRRVAGQRPRGQFGHQVVMLGEQGLTQRGGVYGEQAADLECLVGVVRPEHMVDDQDLVLVQGADPYALAAAGGQPVGPVQGAGAQLVAVQVARAHVQQGRTEPILARLAVLLDESDRLQGAQDPVDRAFGQAELTRQFGYPQSP